LRSRAAILPEIQQSVKFSTSDIQRATHVALLDVGIDGATSAVLRRKANRPRFFVELDPDVAFGEVSMYVRDLGARMISRVGLEPDTPEQFRAHVSF